MTDASGGEPKRDFERMREGEELLEWAEVPFEVMVKETYESYPDNLSMGAIAMHIARNKALAVKEMILHSNDENKLNRTILAADTIVVLNDQVIGKPTNREHAIAILSSLSGQTHHVVTGVVILSATGEIAFADTTEVAFHQLDESQVSFYVDKYKPYDKAGAYAIQEWIGVVGIKSVKGDFYNVMGLPVSKVVQALKQL